MTSSPFPVSARAGAAPGAASDRPTDRLRRPAAADDGVADLQRQMLPEALPRLAGYEFAVEYRPCAAAGGDFYGFQPFDDGRLGFVVADVAGHGNVAAVMMAALRGAFAAFRVFGRARESAPQDVNAVVYEIGVPGMFITAFFVSLDPSTGMLYCGNCGHPRPLVLRAGGGIERLASIGDLPLGIVPSIDPKTVAVGLRSGDALIIYTDGVTEARDAAGREFGDERLHQALAAAADQPADRIRHSIARAVREHQGTTAALDDQCVLVCRRL